MPKAIVSTIKAVSAGVRRRLRHDNPAKYPHMVQ